MCIFEIYKTNVNQPTIRQLENKLTKITQSAPKYAKNIAETALLAIRLGLEVGPSNIHKVLQFFKIFIN